MMKVIVGGINKTGNIAFSSFQGFQTTSSVPVSEANRVINQEKAEQAWNVETEGVHQDAEDVPLLDQILAMNLNDDAQLENDDAQSENDDAESENDDAQSDSSCQSDLEEIL